MRGTFPEQGLICGNGLCKQKLGGFSREHSDTMPTPCGWPKNFLAERFYHLVNIQKAIEFQWPSGKEWIYLAIKKVGDSLISGH